MEKIVRKLIDLPENVIKGLQLRATTDGVSLKQYMETILIEKSEEKLSDEQAYELMLMLYPDGQEALSEDEKEDFESWLGV